MLPTALRASHRRLLLSLRHTIAVPRPFPAAVRASAALSSTARHNESPRRASVVALAAATAATAATLYTAQCEGAADDHALSAAVLYGRADQVRQLLNQGADPNSRRSYGSALLHVAVARGQTEIAQALLEAGADVNARDHYTGHPRDISARLQDFGHFGIFALAAVGLTPLHYAALTDNFAMLQLLISYRADPTLTSLEGLKAKDCSSVPQNRVILEGYEEDPHYAEELGAASAQSVARHAAAPNSGSKAHVVQQLSPEQQKLAALQHRRQNPLEEHLRKHLVGQEGPILAVSAAIRRRLNGWHDRDRPLVFLFLGSSGVGKTEMAKRIAEYVHDEGNGKCKPGHFVRLDMSEFQEKHEVAKLIGAPPGYVGYESGGMLANMLRKCPNAVVLLDEVEKAHPDVLTIMLQLFDEGRLTDGQGRTVSCPNATFIMTSNLGATVIAEHGWNLRQQAEAVQANDDTFELSKTFKDQVMRPILKAHFQRDEFLGRIDEILYFVPFSRRELLQLVELELVKWQAKAQERHGVSIQWDSSLSERITQEYDAHYGARSLQHAVDRLIINRLAAAYEKEELKAGDTVRLSATDDSINFVIQRGAAPASSESGWLSSNNE